MKSSTFELFTSKVLSKASSIRIVGGDDTSGIPIGTDLLLGGGTRPKTTPISSTATHIKNEDWDGVDESATIEFIKP